MQTVPRATNSWDEPHFVLLLSHKKRGMIPMGKQEVKGNMGDKKDVWQGTLALMVLKTLETMGPLHGYGIARRIEQTSGNLLSLNYGTLYPALLKLEREARDWEQAAAIVGRFLAPSGEQA